jgi:hypothetical protein
MDGEGRLLYGTGRSDMSDSAEEALAPADAVLDVRHNKVAFL